MSSPLPYFFLGLVQIELNKSDLRRRLGRQGSFTLGRCRKPWEGDSEAAAVTELGSGCLLLARKSIPEREAGVGRKESCFELERWQSGGDGGWWIQMKALFRHEREKGK